MSNTENVNLEPLSKNQQGLQSALKKYSFASLIKKSFELNSMRNLYISVINVMDKENLQ